VSHTETDGLDRVVFKVPSQKRYRVEALQKREIEIGRKVAYVRVADVTAHLEGQGDYEVFEMKTDRKRFGGYALIAVYEDLKVVKRNLRIHVGISRMSPGEIYNVKLLDKGRKGIVSKFSVIGGDGKAGNGSANSLNGMALSGGDDWDGSSGLKWDVDSFDIRKYALSTKDGLSWSVDPLLQWVFPIGTVTQIDLEGFVKGGENR